MNLNVDALEGSFDSVAPRGDEPMDVFYGRLFAVAPAVRPLFTGTAGRASCVGAPDYQRMPGRRSRTWRVTGG